MRLPFTAVLTSCLFLGVASGVMAQPPLTPRLCLQSQCIDLTTNPIFEVPITITGSGTLAAFGFQLSQFPALFTLLEVIPGPLITGWTHLEGTSSSSATIRVGGYNVTPTPLDGPETLLLTLRLRSQIALPTTTLSFTNLVDDIAGASTCTAVIQGAPPAQFPGGGIVFYPEGQPDQCCFAVPDGTRLQVMAHPDAIRVRWPVRGTSFRIQVVPPAPGALFTWSPAAGVESSQGNPVDNNGELDGGGVQVLLTDCWVPGGEAFALGSITVAGLTGVHTLELRAVEPTQISSTAAECAYFSPCATCGAPTACVTQPDRFPVSYRAVVNSAGCGEPCGTVSGIAITDWGQVKTWYR